MMKETGKVLLFHQLNFLLQIIWLSCWERFFPVNLKYHFVLENHFFIKKNNKNGIISISSIPSCLALDCFFFCELFDFVFIANLNACHSTNHERCFYCLLLLGVANNDNKHKLSYSQIQFSKSFYFSLFLFSMGTECRPTFTSLKKHTLTDTYVEQ